MDKEVIGQGELCFLHYGSAKIKMKDEKLKTHIGDKNNPKAKIFPATRS